MWLLDNNIPRKIHEFLKSQGIPNETARFRRWELFRNGELVEAASNAGFTCIVTQDVEFEKSAKKNLKRFPKMSIVLLRLHQKKGQHFLAQFQEAWKKAPIRPNSGQLIEWP